MSIVRSTPRRASMASALMVLSTIVLLTVGRAGSATATSAGSDGDVVLGSDNFSDTPTSVTNNGIGFGFSGTDTAEPNGIGLVGTGNANGVKGVATGAGNEIFGVTNSDSASGVYGEADGAGGYGVAGRANDAAGIGVLADGLNGTGLKATGGAIGVDASGGPYGYGVLATVYGGTAVNAWSRTGPDGCVGSAITAFAESTGTAIAARSDDGVALSVTGKLNLSRAGVTTVPAGKSSVRVVLVNLTPGVTFVIGTLQSPASGVWVRAIVVNSTSGFIIYLNKGAATAVGVAWLVLS